MFKRLFGIKPDDWITLWVEQGYWKLFPSGYHPIWSEGLFYQSDAVTTYKIKYSPSRGKYKLICMGVNPHNHHMYKTALRQLSNYQLHGHG